MPLFLVETPLPTAGDGATDQLFDLLATAAQHAGGELIEIQVGVDAGLVYAIFEHDAAAAVQSAVTGAGVPVSDFAPVRLVGADVADLKASRQGASWLVEWDIPAGVSMEQYLSRKKEKAPLYASVPEARFLRTYVREDMIKCLCFYDAPDEAAVRRARQAVDTPIDRLSRLA